MKVLMLCVNYCSWPDPSMMLTLLVPRSRSSAGQLVSSSRSIYRSSAHYSAVPFTLIESVLNFCVDDCLFTAGSAVLRRVIGWPMGGALSEPGTMVGLGRYIYKLYNDDETMQASILYRADVPFRRGFFCLQHVDDFLLGSKIWCNKCLMRFLSDTLPKSCGVELEESGTRIRFLQLAIRTVDDDVVILPYNCNVHFALGRLAVPLVSRFPVYDPVLAPWKDCKTLLVGFLMQYDHILHD